MMPNLVVLLKTGKCDKLVFNVLNRDNKIFLNNYIWQLSE